MLEFLLVLFFVISIVLIVNLQKNKKMLNSIHSELEKERRVSHQNLADVRNERDQLKAKLTEERRITAEIIDERALLRDEVAKLKAQANSKPARRAARKAKSTQKK